MTTRPRRVEAASNRRQRERAAAPWRERPTRSGGTSVAHPRMQPAQAPIDSTGTATQAHTVPRPWERRRQEGKEAEDGGREGKRETAHSSRAPGASTAADGPADPDQQIGTTIRRERDEAEGDGGQRRGGRRGGESFRIKTVSCVMRAWPGPTRNKSTGWHPPNGATRRRPPKLAHSFDSGRVEGRPPLLADRPKMLPTGVNTRPQGRGGRRRGRRRTRKEGKAAHRRVDAGVSRCARGGTTPPPRCRATAMHARLDRKRSHDNCDSDYWLSNASYETAFKENKSIYRHARADKSCPPRRNSDFGCPVEIHRPE